MKPLDWVNLSLSPVVRVRTENILLHMLIPDGMAHDQQKKYFDFAVNYELRDMFHNGIDGVKIKVFSTSLDTPGRADLLGMESCSSYTPCCVCTHCFRPGVGSATKLIFDGYRTYLGMNSRGRRRRVGFRGHLYEYYRECTRQPPKIRDNKSVRDAIAFARHRKSPYMGHKDLPLISRVPGFDWYRMSPPDWMHGAYLCTIYSNSLAVSNPISPCTHADSKIFCEMLIKCMIGKGLGVVDDMMGGYSWSKDATHRREAQALGVFRDIWPDRNGPLPWRLTPDQLRLLDKRMQRVVWPHYMDPLYYDGCSFWVKPGRLWKARRKVNILSFVISSLTHCALFIVHY